MIEGRQKKENTMVNVNIGDYSVYERRPPELMLHSVFNGPLTVTMLLHCCPSHLM